MQFRLSVWLSLAILVVALAAGIFSFVVAFQEAIELQDDGLLQAAVLVSRYSSAVATNDGALSAPEIDADARIVVRLLRADNGNSPPSAPLEHDLFDLPINLPDGFQTVIVHSDSWRLYIKTIDPTARIVVGQRTAMRDEIARDSALRTLLPLLVLIPILLVLVGYLIRKMLLPLKAMANTLDLRSDDDLGKVADEHLPSEIRPFVVAINRLLSRVADSVATQRRFVADAAHELRSPLTALSLQAEQLAAADMSPQAKDRLSTLRRGIQRARGLVDQLLVLARVQASNYGRTELVSVQQVFRQVLEDLMPLAEAKAIDLGVVGKADAKVRIQEADLRTLVKNLVDNAIRYTPNGGKVDLSLHVKTDAIILQVSDTGPGIEPSERDRVFDPFYRVLDNDEIGSGLGLSIVHKIARRAGARVRLGYSDESNKSGLSVNVFFPSA